MTSEFVPGLEGVVAAQTEISEVDGHQGRLIYRGGYLIEELAHLSFEEVAHLLWTGSLPSPQQLSELKTQLAAARSLNDASRAATAALDLGVDPMDALRTGLSAHGAGPGCPKPTLDQAIGLVAAVPTIVAAFRRRQQGKDEVAPRADLDHAANFLWMMTGEEPKPEQARWLEAYLILLADHGLNASTFAARVVASTGADLTSAMVGAVGALKGPAHGGAATAAMKMLNQVGGPEKAEAFVIDVLDKHGRLMGFGHRVYRTYDPRATILRQLVQSANPTFYAVASKVEEVALRELLARHPERPNATNVDYYSAGVLAGAGLPHEYFTCAFAASRIVGWSAHVLEYMAKDGRILRPASQWIGPDPSQRVVAKA
ncbi:MAG TPA: citrate/2-methylcitrate synthase [Candidatus Acidoferrales bacterium]|nr:citrate/2-methylcitrate synthase [Candidatus Acidoferrales bacterium]